VLSAATHAVGSTWATVSGELRGRYEAGRRYDRSISGSGVIIVMRTPALTMFGSLTSVAQKLVALNSEVIWIRPVMVLVTPGAGSRPRPLQGIMSQPILEPCQVLAGVTVSNG
jgi:hypothetical protein